MSLKDIIEAKAKAMPFEAVNDLLAEEKADVDRLEEEVRETTARGAAVNSREVLDSGDATRKPPLARIEGPKPFLPQWNEEGALEAFRVYPV
jgi:hypothetical protein